MVTTLVRPLVAVVALRRAVILVVIVLAAVLGPGAVAAAQPSSGNTTYGFNTDCDNLHNDLQNFGIPGTPINLGNAVSGLCKAGNVATHPGDAVNAVKDAAWDSTFGKVVTSMLTGLAQAMTLGLTFWAKVPNYTVDDLPSLMAKVRQYTDTIQIYLLAASIMLCGVRLAAAKASAAAEEATEAFRVLLRTAIASSMWAGLIVLGTHASDNFAAWVITDATNNNAKGVVESIVQTSALTAFSPGLVLIFAVVGLLSAILQIVLAVIREGLLVVVTGVLPLAASASGARAGQQFHHKLLLWSVAFVLYKPLAAIAYMIAFTVAGNSATALNAKPDSATAAKQLVAIALLCSVAFVLPAIMRLISPVASMGSGGVGGAAFAGGVLAGGGGAAGMVGRLASGAADSRGGGTVSSNPGGGNRPTGAAPASNTGGQGSGSPKGASTAGKAGGAAGTSGAAGAGGPYVAAAKAAGQAVGGGLRAADSTVNQATTAGSSTPPPTGTGGSQVPR